MDQKSRWVKAVATGSCERVLVQSVGMSKWGTGWKWQTVSALFTPQDCTLSTWKPSVLVSASANKYGMSDVCHLSLHGPGSHNALLNTWDLREGGWGERKERNACTCIYILADGKHMPARRLRIDTLRVFLFFSSNNFAILYGRIENSIKTLPKKTHLSKAGPSYLSLWNLGKRKTKIQWCKIISVHIYFMLPRLWVNLVKVPQSGSGCRLPPRHWGLSAQICCAVTFPGLHLHSLQSGSVGQCSVCVFVWVSVLFWSAGIWCPAGYGKWMVAQLAMGLMGFFSRGAPHRTKYLNYSTCIPLKKKKYACAYHITNSTSCCILLHVVPRESQVHTLFTISHGAPHVFWQRLMPWPHLRGWSGCQFGNCLLYYSQLDDPPPLKWNATINILLGTKIGSGCIALLSFQHHFGLPWNVRNICSSKDIVAKTS